MKSLNKVSILTSLACTGNPTANKIKADIHAEAKPIDTLEPPFKGIMIGNDEFKFDFIPELERLKIWSQLFKDTNTTLY